MPYLPRLSAGDADCRLPLFEESAALLLDALLEEDAAARVRRLETALANDPSLTIWSAVHPLRPATAPHDLGELALWLAEHLPGALVEPDAVEPDAAPRSECAEAGSEHYRPGVPPGPDAAESARDAAELLSSWLSRAQTLRRSAELAASATESPAAASRARMLVYLRAAPEWLSGGAVSSSMPVLERLAPEWLRRLSEESPPPQPEDAAPDDPAEVLTAPCWSKRLGRLAERLTRLRRLEADFAATLRREKLASLQKLAYGASHEINNPLANIATRAQTLLHGETDPERRRALATINDQAFRAFEMIANMMLFAKPPELNLAPTDLKALLAEVIAEMTPAAQAQGTELRTACEEPQLVILADATQLAVLLRALCRNALEAVEAGGEVNVSLRRAGEHARLVVRDTGPGLSAEAQRHLFDPFYSSREAGRGLGFGLSWCWTIVEAHQGEIACDAAAERGAALMVSLPLRGPAAGQA